MLVTTLLSACGSSFHALTFVCVSENNHWHTSFDSLTFSFGITMATFGGAPSSANMSTDNPLAMPTSAAGFQHGSAEQNDASSVLGSYLDSMGGTSPRTSFTLPRSLSPRMRSRSARSHNDDDDNSSRREDRSREREPVGTGFRLTSLQQTTGVHAREIQQLKTIVETLVADRTMTGQRLDSVFNHVDMKFIEAISRVDQFTETYDDNRYHNAFCSTSTFQI